MDNDDFLILIIGALVVYTLYATIRAIHYAWREAMDTSDASSFWKNVFSYSGGNIILIFVFIFLIGLPVYFILKMKIPKNTFQNYYQSNHSVESNKVENHSSEQSYRKTTPQKTDSHRKTTPMGKMINISIGRSKDNDVVLDNPKVSRYHARLFSNNQGEFFIEDANSSNGVFVNGNKVNTQKLGDADIVEIADQSFNWKKYI
jgi:hypothetical protein